MVNSIAFTLCRDRPKLSNCRRELVNAYTYKATAKEKCSLAVKRLRFEDVKTKLLDCRRRVFSEKENFALISAYCFGKASELCFDANAFLLTFAAKGKSKCPAAARAAKLIVL